MPDIIGACVFRNDGDGCLSSKYVNQFSPPFGESCHLVQPSSSDGSDPFIGTFKTVWLEQDTAGVIDMGEATLTIKKTAMRTYELHWSTPKEPNLHTGVGMMYDGLLTCAYWSK